MSAPVLRIKAPTKAEQKKESQARKLKPLGTGMMLPGLVAEQKRMLDRRTYGTQPAASGRITNSSTRGKYKGEVVDQSSMRHGANDFLQIPSRFNNDLRYRDGRKVML